VIEAPERLAAAASLGTVALPFLFRDILNERFGLVLPEKLLARADEVIE